MSDQNSESGRRDHSTQHRRRGGSLFVAGGLVILAILGGYIAVDLSGHRIGIAQGTVEISPKAK